MKILINKLKKVNKIKIILFFISLISYTVAYILLSKSLLQLSGIETVIRSILIILFFIYLIFYLLSSLINLITKKNIKYYIFLIITIILTVIFFFISYYINTIYNSLSNLNKDTITYTTNLITLNDNEFNKNSNIGMINNEDDIEGYILANKLIKKENLKNDITLYDDYYKMLRDLYNQDIDAIFVSGNYKVLFNKEEPYTNIATDTKIIYKYSEKLKNQDNLASSNKKLTEPFTVLLMGVDSELNGLNANQAFNGDTLMLITFNPKTLTASMFSIPRDLYVPIACNNDKLSKINSSAAYGTKCVIDTITNLTDINIDYYVKINFKGVVSLVDALGGITVDVPIDFCEQNSNREFGDATICLKKGVQTLNGEEALALARHRKTLPRGDIDRIANQQKIIEALINKVKNIRSFQEFENILNSVSNNTATNMTTNQILSFYNVGKDILINTLSGEDINFDIKKTYLEYYDLPVYLPYSGITTSALGYYQESLDEIITMMKVNLNLIEETPNKTFKIDYNEDYTTKVYGKKLYGGEKIKTMTNLIGKSKEEAINYANEVNINIEFVEVDQNSEYYNPYVTNNKIAAQSIHENALLANYNELTIYINNVNEELDNNLDNNNNNDNNNEDNETTDPIIPNSPEDESNGNDTNEEEIGTQEKDDNDIIIENED